MLLALVLAHRSSDLKRLSLQGRTQRLESTSCQWAWANSASRDCSRACSPYYFIAAFTEDLSLCPRLCLQQYEETTKELRPKDGSQQLLIATVAPHKPVVSSTIARWLKEVLSASGVDVSIFQAHSTRGLQHLQLPCWCYDPDHHGTGRMVTAKYLLQILLP